MGANKDVCSAHPEFDPQNNTMWIRDRRYRQCLTCCGLYYGVKSVGECRGEFPVSKKAINDAKIRIGPMTLVQLGLIRNSFIHCNKEDGLLWFTDSEKMMIYLNQDSSRSKVVGLCNEYGCDVYRRSWDDPKMHFMNLTDVMNHDGGELSLEFGDNNTKVSLMIKVGMSAKEVGERVSQFLDNLNKIPHEHLSEVKIVE